MLDEIIRNAIKDYCIEFTKYPYLCYTEHGLHALFFNRLYTNIPKERHYFEWEGKKVCVIQKEYPTASKLDKPTRQHWDISIIKTPPEVVPKRDTTYDFLRLYAAIEFGMNEGQEHLIEDIRRLSHPESYVDNKFVVHFYRISDLISGRDWTPRSKRILSTTEIQSFVGDSEVEVFFAQVDETKTHETGFWHINKSSVTKIGGGI